MAPWLATTPAAGGVTEPAIVAGGVVLGVAALVLAAGWWVSARRYRRLAAEASHLRHCMEDLEKTGESLRKARSRQEAILESITDAFCALDRQWRFTYLNSQAEALFGMSRGELLGTVFWERYPYILGTVFEERFRSAVESGEAVHFEAQSPLTGRWYEVHAYPGESGLCVYGRDVTFRRRAEEELRESEGRFRTIADAAPVMIWMAEADGRVNYFNRRWTEFTGRSLQEELANWSESIHAEDRERKIRTYHEALGRQAAFSQQFRMRRADGAYRWVHETGVPRFSPGGMFLGFAGTAVDVTDLLDAEAARRETERHFRETLENLELIAVMLDADGTITFCNDCLLRLTGWRREEVIGRSWFAVFVHAPDRLEAEQAHRRAVRAEAVPAYYENSIMTRDGQRLLIAWNNTLLRDADGRPAGVTSLGVDITRQRWAEEQLIEHKSRLEQLVAERTAALTHTYEQLRLSERLVSIGTLAAGLGHDMNNLLLPIRMRVDSLESLPLPTEVREGLESIRQSAEYLQQLTNGLRALAQSPEDPASSPATELAAWWAEIRPMLRAALRRDVELVGEIPAGLPPVCAGRAGLTQAVLNLVSNAGDALGGPGQVRVWAELAEGGGHVRLGVTDNGPGMTPEVAKRAMEPFFTTKARGVGTGLGLSLVHGVVKRIGGSVRIDTMLGRGTTIVLELPIVRLAASPGGPEPQAVVSLADPRLATFAVTFLSTLGFLVRRNGVPDPDGATLWITDATDRSLEAARRFVERDSRRRVVAIGPYSEEWALIGARVVDTVGRPGALREALSETVSLWRETDRDRPSDPSVVC